MKKSNTVKLIVKQHPPKISRIQRIGVYLFYGIWCFSFTDIAVCTLFHVFGGIYLFNRFCVHDWPQQEYQTKEGVIFSFLVSSSDISFLKWTFLAEGFRISGKVGTGFWFWKLFLNWLPVCIDDLKVKIKTWEILFCMPWKKIQRYVVNFLKHGTTLRFIFVLIFSCCLCSVCIIYKTHLKLHVSFHPHKIVSFLLQLSFVNYTSLWIWCS